MISIQILARKATPILSTFRALNNADQVLLKYIIFGKFHTSSMAQKNACCPPPTGPAKMDLRCKVALVTGGASGIGYAVADELLEEGLYKVIIGDLDPCQGMNSANKLNECHGENKCCFLPLNVACSQQFEEVLKKVKCDYNRLDLLVNNAGVVDDSNIDQELDVNLRSILFGTYKALEVMSGQPDKGAIINIGDTKGLSGCKYFPSYAATKSGVHTFSMGIGQVSECEAGVRVLALAPGLTDTKMGTLFENKPDPPMCSQRVSAVAKAVIHTAKFAESASLWVIENSILYKAQWPNKSSYLEKITAF